MPQLALALKRRIALFLPGNGGIAVALTEPDCLFYASQLGYWECVGVCFAMNPYSAVFRAWSDLEINGSRAAGTGN